MEIAEQEKQRLNEIYHALSMKHAQIYHGLRHRGFELDSGFYNGHQHRSPDGDRLMDYYPIPAVSVKGVCDVEIGF